ncbi:hypothetical protein ACFSFY_14370 [Sporosarcina siberiensis]|uniref:Aspartate aminotransferase n=1 Tax=Sporosarcina siberiensis TaxID=1365606 RepID=A0ABW4SJP7_9BACL
MAGFVTRVLEETGANLTPGNAFGPSKEENFRMSLSVQTEILFQAIGRIKKILQIASN